MSHWWLLPGHKHDTNYRNGSALHFLLTSHVPFHVKLLLSESFNMKNSLNTHEWTLYGPNISVKTQQ